MDPTSAASLGLGVVSLSFQLFAGCIKGFVLLSTAHNLGKDSSTLICMLDLQEIQLTEWARCAGLLAENGRLDRRLNETVVQATLKELKDLLLDTDKLKLRYTLSLATKSSTPQNEPGKSESPVARGILSNAISDDLRGDIMYRARLIQSKNNFPQRLWWAAVDKTKFEDLIDRIKSFIRELWCLLDPIRQGDMSQSLQMILSHVISMSGKIEELSSLRETILPPSDISDTLTSKDAILPFATVAEVKAIQINAGAVTTDRQLQGARSPPLQYFSQVSKDLQPGLGVGEVYHYEPLRTNAETGTGMYEDEYVFVEWKSLPGQFRSKIIHRVENLAMLLATPKHPDFRSLKCIGLLLDNDRGKAAFIYKAPSFVANHIPRSLRNLFGLGPSVTQRIQLALQITQSVKYFHTAGWLHKNLRSENIMFWDTQKTDIHGVGRDVEDKNRLPEPVLVGFAFSRQDSPSEISEQPSSDPQRDIYRHPKALGEPSESFSAAKDTYALGTVLLEIGEWRSLRSLVEKVVDVSKPNVFLDQLARVKPFLLDEGPRGRLGMLKYRMGEIYARVTKMMLSGEIPPIPQAQKEAGIMFRPELLDIAIHELGRCIV